MSISPAEATRLRKLLREQERKGRKLTPDEEISELLGQVQKANQESEAKRKAQDEAIAKAKAAAKKASEDANDVRSEPSIKINPTTQTAPKAPEIKPTPKPSVPQETEFEKWKRTKKSDVPEYHPKTQAERDAEAAEFAKNVPKVKYGPDEAENYARHMSRVHTALDKAKAEIKDLEDTRKANDAGGFIGWARNKVDDINKWTGVASSEGGKLDAARKRVKELEAQIGNQSWDSGPKHPPYQSTLDNRPRLDWAPKLPTGRQIKAPVIAKPKRPVFGKKITHEPQTQPQHQPSQVSQHIPKPSKTVGQHVDSAIHKVQTGDTRAIAAGMGAMTAAVLGGTYAKRWYDARKIRVGEMKARQEMQAAMAKSRSLSPTAKNRLRKKTLTAGFTSEMQLIEWTLPNYITPWFLRRSKPGQTDVDIVNKHLSDERKKMLNKPGIQDNFDRYTLRRADLYGDTETGMEYKGQEHMWKNNVHYLEDKIFKRIVLYKRNKNSVVNRVVDKDKREITELIKQYQETKINAPETIGRERFVFPKFMTDFLAQGYSLQQLKSMGLVAAGMGIIQGTYKYMTSKDI